MEMLSDKESVINELNELALQKKYVFRGISNENQKLPHIVREGLESKEVEMLELLEKNAAFYLNDADFFGLASQAQHYGIPTRLLDFTYNPFVALYFALYEKLDTGGYTIIVSDATKKQESLKIPISLIYDGLMTGRTLAENYNKTLRMLWYDNAGRHDQGISKEISGIVSRREILFIDSKLSNQRLIMQQGLFMLPYTLDEEKHREILKNNTKEICIDVSLRSELLEYLNTLGINAYRVMPDLASICQYIKKIAKEKM